MFGFHDILFELLDKFFRGRPASREDVLGIKPLALRVDRQRDVAIVTFELGPKLDNRRTFVFRRDATGWRVWHHHASRLVDFDAILEAEVQKRLSEIRSGDGSDPDSQPQF